MKYDLKALGIDYKQMVYRESPYCDILLTGMLKNYKFYIVSLGTHPTAYIEIPCSNKLFKKDYWDIDLNVHGGLTYSENYLLDMKDSCFIGWDYSNCSDCHFGLWNGKKWTTEEIFDEVCQAIDEIIEMERGDKND